MTVGGAEVLTARLVRRLTGQFRVVLACLDEVGQLGEDLRNEGFPVEVLGRRQGLDVKCISRLAAFFRRERVDLIHAHQYTPFSYALLARWLRGRTPILFLEHGRHQPDFPRRKRIWANRLLLRRRDRVLGVGEAVRRALIDNEGIRADRVGVIYNGIPLSRFHVTPALRTEVRAELGLSADVFVVIHVARLDPIKDHATALRSFARVLQHRPDAQLLMVGDGPERTNIENLRRTLGIENPVHLLGTRSDVHRLLATANVFLLTSTSEGIPLTVIEAMAAGLPVVATQVGGMSEVVQDAVTGYLAPAGSDEALAKHLLHLAGDPAHAASLGAQGRRRAQEQFSEDEMVNRYVQVYREMLSPRPAVV